MYRLVLTCSAILATCVLASADIASTFDSDLDGWTTDETGLFQHNASDGNPGGFLFIDNDEGTNNAHIFAPNKFLGDLTSFNGGTISFDGNLLGSGGNFFSDPDDYGVFVITGTAGSASLDLAPGGAIPPANSWQTYSASLDATTWGVSSSQWASILGDVTSIQLSVEALFGEEAHGIDNVRITAVPEPSSGVVLTAFVGLTALIRRRSLPLQPE
ncbi:MAG: hypothetical protein AAGA03_01455 [Planctomycetota bacterium]